MGGFLAAKKPQATEEILQNRKSWFKFNNLGLALGTNLTFYTSLSKGLKLKVIKFWSLSL